MPSQLEIETVLKIIKLRIAEGMGYRSIARKVGVDWKTVRKYVKLYEKL
jgi:transposase